MVASETTRRRDKGKRDKGPNPQTASNFGSNVSRQGLGEIGGNVELVRIFSVNPVPFATSRVCILHIKPFFLPVDIHRRAWCGCSFVVCI